MQYIRHSTNVSISFFLCLFQIPGLSPTADWFTSSASPDSATLPPSKTPTIKSSTDVGLNKDTMDNSLPEDNSEGRIVKNSGDELLTEGVQDNKIAKDGQGSRLYEMDDPEQVTSENLWERTEVLAGKDGAEFLSTWCWNGLSPSV